jgi:transposase-like protein
MSASERKFTDEQCRADVAAGMTDAAIGRKYGASSWSVAVRRAKLGLAANRRPEPPPPPLDRVRELHGRGLGDAELARELGVSATTANKWRRQAGLPSQQSRHQDLTGQEFNGLTALRPVGKQDHQILWECRCRCGGITRVKSHYLRIRLFQGCKHCRQNGPVPKEVA